MTIQAGQNFTSSDGVTAQFGLGDEAEVSGASWKYVKTSAAVVEGDALIIHDDGLASPLTTTLVTSTIVADVGVAQFAIASGEYGWVAIGPFGLKSDGTSFKVKAAASCAADVKLYATATAGVVDDAVTALISGLRLTTAIVGAGLADCTAVLRIGVGRS